MSPSSRPRPVARSRRDARDALRSFLATHAEFGGGAAASKLEALRRLGRARLRGAAEVRAFHEALCFLRAIPDDREVLDEVELALGAFARRGDLRAHRRALESSGIAGTDIVYPFFWPTARWHVRRWPERLRVEWRDLGDPEGLKRLLPLLTTRSEMPLVDEFDYPLPEWMRRLKGKDETDAAFLVRSFERLRMSDEAREKTWDALGVTLRLAAGPGTPSRTLARHAPAPVVFRRTPLDRTRPDLRRLADFAPRAVRSVSAREGRALIDLAREAMVTRERDLDVFSYGDPADVRLVECGGGLQFAAIGAIPRRRLLLESVYGFLTLQDGVPTGYVLTSALFGSSEIAYNVFDTWRGGEASRVYAHVLAMTAHLFRSDTFVVFPYQLGWHNAEGLKSGAWWFYQKLGFRAKNQAVLALMDRELGTMRRRPGHRSSLATLRRLSEEPVYFHSRGDRQDVIGVLSLGDIGRRASELLTSRYGSARAEGVQECAREAARLLAVTPSRTWLAAERASFADWSPLVLALPGVARWSDADRRALAAVMRAKGGRRESAFVHLFDRHLPLRRALRTLATPEA